MVTTRSDVVGRAVVGVGDVGLDDVLEPGPAVPAVEEPVEDGPDDLDRGDDVAGEERVVDDPARGRVEALAVDS